MANVIDYLGAEGAQPFSELAFNEVDNVVLSQLAYLDLGGVVGKGPAGAGVTVSDAWRAWAQAHSLEEIYSQEFGDGLTPFLLQAMAASPRFATARLTGFVERVDPVCHEQFAALTTLLPDGSTYVAFRGTDHSIRGWREDFMLSFEVVAAQRDAAAYLDAVARATIGPLRVGGHSKGGNLAAYVCSAAPRPVRERVVELWCNDSPGFDPQVVDWPALIELAPLTHLIVPSWCVVGSLMRHAVEPQLHVASSASGVMQHELMSWRVEGHSLVPGIPEAESVRLQGVFRELLERRDLPGRRAFVTDVFGAIEATGATTFEELLAQGPLGIEKVVSGLGAYDRDTRDTVAWLIGSLVGGVVDSALGASPRTGMAPDDKEAEAPTIEGMRRFRERRARARQRRVPLDVVGALTGGGMLTSAVVMLVGILVMANANVRAPILGYATLVALALWAGLLIVRHVRALRRGGEADQEDLVVGGTTLVVVVAVMVFRVSMNVVYNLTLSLGLLAQGLLLARREARAQGQGARGLLRRPWGVFALLCLATGVVLAVNPTVLAGYPLLAAGALLVVLGAHGLIVW